MYRVEKFDVRDLKVLFPLIERYPFATISSIESGKPFVNQLPVTSEMTANGQLQLIGHMSRRNPQWRHFQVGSPVVIAFHGPHAYINPSWYVQNDVPTWNYVAIQASGIAKLVEDYEGLIDLLKKTTDHMNRINQDKWDFYLPSDLATKADLTNAIVGFRLCPDELVGKFKLSQNKSHEDQSRVIEGLKLRKDEGSRGIAELMSKLVE